MRIAKYISNAGYCSRRDAEKLVLEKKVYVNSELCEKPNINVNYNDKILVCGKIIKLDSNIKLWKFYKPTNVICTNKDPKKRKTIFDILPKNLPRVISIGRLDFMSEGLILLTNNGDFARKMELPSSNILRVYRVCIKGKVSEDVINKINFGISINGIFYKKIKVKIEKKTNLNYWLIFKLREGKNREIRNVCKFYKWTVIKLIRLQYGSIRLTKQNPGQIEEIKNIPSDLS